MSAVILDATGGIITVKIDGVLSPTEISANHSDILEQLRYWQGGSILCICDEFEGWTHSNWETLRYRDQAESLIHKMAVIGESRWKKLSFAFAACGFRHFPISYFEPGGLEEATKWLSA